jgi:DNA-binding response OmpR family regulator
MTAVFHYGDHLVNADSRSVHLTPKEAELLAVLAKNHDRVVTSATIIGSLWPHEADEPETVSLTMRQHLFRLREKLAGTGLHLETIVGLGVRLTGEIEMDWSVR